LPSSDLTGKIFTQILKIFHKYLLKESLAYLICSILIKVDVTFMYFKPGTENYLLIRPPSDLKIRKCHLRKKWEDPQHEACSPILTMTKEWSRRY
jgi:hypothetical protein